MLASRYDTPINKVHKIARNKYRDTNTSKRGSNGKT